MKKTKPSTLADLLSLAETAMNALHGAQKEIGESLLSKRDVIVRKMELVTRDEFDAAFAIIKKTRDLQGDLDVRLARLEKKLNLSRPEKIQKKKQKATK